VHRSGDEASWWSKTGINPLDAARALWSPTHPLRSDPDAPNSEPLASHSPSSTAVREIVMPRPSSEL
jgi:hypothetical protein